MMWPPRERRAVSGAYALLVLGGVLLAVGVVADSITWFAVACVTIVIGYAVGATATLRALHLDERRRLADLAARRALLVERYEARRFELDRVRRELGLPSREEDGR